MKLSPETTKKIKAAIGVFAFYKNLCDENSPQLVEYQRLYADTIWKGRLAQRLLYKLVAIRELQQYIEGEKDVDAFAYYKTIKAINDSERQLLEILQRMFQEVSPQQLDISTFGWRSATF